MTRDAGDGWRDVFGSLSAAVPLLVTFAFCFLLGTQFRNQTVDWFGGKNTAR